MNAQIVKGKKLEFEVKAFVATIVREILDDPDFGFELSEKAKKRLRSARHIKKGKPLSEIIKKYY